MLSVLVTYGTGEGQTAKVAKHVASVNTEDLEVLADLLEGGTVTPVIDGSYPLSEAPEAIRYLEAGHARGKVVITVEAATRFRAKSSFTNERQTPSQRSETRTGI